MNRNEQLEWLARNAHEWAVDESLTAVLFDGEDGLFPFFTGTGGGFTRQEWLERRAELQGKPSWEDAPEWASTIAQQPTGDWMFFESYYPNVLTIGGKEKWSTHSCGGRYSYSKGKGEVLGDWQDTLESRPTEETKPIRPDDMAQEFQGEVRGFDSGIAGVSSGGMGVSSGGLSAKYPNYYKDVSSLNEVDVYQVHELFGVKDASGCLQHASKKILLSGERNGGKSLEQDIREARDTLTRKLQIMRVEQ